MMIPQKYTPEQIYSLHQYLYSEDYERHSSRTREDALAAYYIEECKFEMASMLEGYVNLKLDLMSYAVDPFTDMSVGGMNSRVIYFVIKALSIKTEDLPLYINSKVYLVKVVVLWRIGKGF